MKRSLTILITIVAFLLAFEINLAKADSNSQSSQSSKIYGKTYAEWSAAWLQWALAIPGSTNPITDTTGEFAAIGQSGKVWFLAGTGGDKLTRNITVPHDKALFFPIVNSYWINVPELGDNEWSPQQEALAKATIYGWADSITNLALIIDGRSIPNLYNYRVKSPTVICPLPLEDSLFGGPLLNKPHQCLTDGYWILLPPLSAGKHTIQFRGNVVAANTSSDVTYNITVKSERKDRFKCHR